MINSIQCTILCILIGSREPRESIRSETTRIAHFTDKALLDVLLSNGWERTPGGFCAVRAEALMGVGAPSRCSSWLACPSSDLIPFRLCGSAFIESCVLYSPIWDFVRSTLLACRLGQVDATSLADCQVNDALAAYPLYAYTAVSMRRCCPLKCIVFNHVRSCSPFAGDLSDVLKLEFSNGQWLAFKDFDSGSALDSALALVEHLMEGS